jgi:outer membrane protein assembly factor BamB
MKLGTTAALAVALIAQAAAQEPKPTAPRLLVRQQIVSPTTLKPTEQLGLTGYVRQVQWLGEQRYAVDEVAVDLAAMEVLEVSRERVLLRTVGKRVLWSVDRTAAGVRLDAKAAHRLLLGARVVLPRAGGGLVGLDRATGEVRWQHADAPSEFVIADGELVIAAGAVGDKPTLAAFAAPNGARAFACTLPAAATRLVAGPHGIAAAMASGVTVFDRSGPQLFTLPAAVVDLVAGPDGWFAVTRETLQAWDRTGKVVWSLPATVDTFNSVVLGVTGAGALLELRHCPMSDSGVTVVCREPSDGGVLWQYVDQGLGIAHSKYWHRAHARAIGDAVFVVSEAAGGNFVVELDAATGEKRQRATIAAQ